MNENERLTQRERDLAATLEMVKRENLTLKDQLEKADAELRVLRRKENTTASA